MAFKIRDLDETQAPLLDHLIELRARLLRAFVASRFGDTVTNDMLRQPQALMGVHAEVIGEASAPPSAEDVPTPDGRIGDIQSAPR